MRQALQRRRSFGENGLGSGSLSARFMTHVGTIDSGPGLRGNAKTAHSSPLPKHTVEKFEYSTVLHTILRRAHTDMSSAATPHKIR